MRAAIPFSLWIAALVAAGTPALAEKPPKPTALIAGTVFRDPGFAFPGVPVVLEPKPEDPTSQKGKGKVKVKTMKSVSDSRGEFAFRVPPGPMRYHLSIQAPGHAPENRTIEVAGEERQDVYVTLKPLPPEGPR